jgi:murein DD-endopeptidase MepM/ murein hydrolase activator NlpD
MDCLFPVLDNQRRILERQEVPTHGQGWRFGTPRYDAQGKAFPHDGVDMGEQTSEPIRAPMDYEVSAQGIAKMGGVYLRLLHEGETIRQSGYCHLSGYAPGLSVGDKGVKGKIIGYVGNTGLSNGSHLHFQLWDRQGKNIDPLPWLHASMIEDPVGGKQMIDTIPVGGIMERK